MTSGGIGARESYPISLLLQRSYSSLPAVVCTQPHAAKQPLTTSSTASPTAYPSASNSRNLLGMLSSVSLPSGGRVRARAGGTSGVRVGGVGGAVGESEGSG